MSTLSKEDVLRDIEDVMEVAFSKEQKEAIFSNGKPLNVLSCAGSGKTTTLIGKMLFMEQYYGISPINILAITFNKEAIVVLEKRYYKFRKKLGLPGNKKVTFKTYHALYHLLLKSKFTDLQWSEIGDFKKYFKKLEYSVKRNLKKYDDETLETVMNIRGYQVNNMLSYEDLQKTPKFLVADIPFDGYVKVIEEYEDLKKQDNRIDFDDLQLLMYEELKKNKDLVDKIHDTWEYFVVDEYQDISKVQLDILKIMVKDKNKLTAIGDDDQSIYEFRGSKTEYIVDFGVHFVGAVRVVMDTNYRVPENVLLPVTFSIENNTKRVAKQMKASNAGGELNYLMSSGSAQSGLLVTSEVEKLVAKGESLNDMVILIRNNSQQRIVLDALLAKNLPVKTTSKYSLSGHLVIKDITDIVELALNEKNAELFGKVYKKIMKFINGKVVTEVVSKMKHTNSSWREHMLMMSNPSIHEASSMLYAVEGLIQNNEPFEKVVNEIQKIYREYLKYMVTVGMDANEIGEMINYLKVLGKEDVYKEVYTGIKRREQLKEYFSVSGDDSITISTMHRMKGLEYKYVFLLDLTESVVPNNSIEDEIREKFGNKNADDYIEQERRLFYVAWTRAKDGLYVIVNQKNPSRFIVETIQGMRKAYMEK